MTGLELAFVALGSNVGDSIELIRSALIHTGGRQRPAARLLRTKVTTLNTKIKRYKIDIPE